MFWAGEHPEPMEMKSEAVGDVMYCYYHSYVCYVRIQNASMPQRFPVPTYTRNVRLLIEMGAKQNITFKPWRCSALDPNFTALFILDQSKTTDLNILELCKVHLYTQGLSIWWGCDS